MSKKLILLPIGTLSALALAVLPAAAHAGEFSADCSSGATCTALVSGGVFSTLEDDSGSAAGKVICTNVSGTAAQTHGSSTGSVQLLFHGCKDETLLTNCTSAKQPAGTVTTAVMTSHLIFIDSTPSQLQGILLTGVNVTFTCAGGLITKTVTGNIIGKIENADCGVAHPSFALTFQTLGLGRQWYTQVTTTGTSFDLTSGSHANDATTSALSAFLNLSYTEGKTVKLTC